MSLTLHYFSKPGYSITESILFAEKKLLEEPKIAEICTEIDGKIWIIKRGDKITDIMENCCRIKFDIEGEINLPFKDDDCKFYFYTMLLKHDYSAIAPFAVSLASNVDKHIKENGDISSIEFYNMEEQCINHHPISQFSLMPYSTAIIKTRELLKKCMAYSDKIREYSAPVTKF